SHGGDCRIIMAARNSVHLRRRNLDSGRPHVPRAASLPMGAPIPYNPDVSSIRDMRSSMAEKITPRATDYSQWYLDIVNRAGLAENSDVRGCMVIKPHGYAIWEKMQRALDRLFKETSHVNAYFPLFIPKSFFAREEQMAQGFAKECAVVTHHRLKALPGGTIEVDPGSRLEEELIIRPTSETIIWNTYRTWIQSYR